LIGRNAPVIEDRFFPGINKRPKPGKDYPYRIQQIPQVTDSPVDVLFRVKKSHFTCKRLAVWGNELHQTPGPRPWRPALGLKFDSALMTRPYQIVIDAVPLGCFPNFRLVHLKVLSQVELDPFSLMTTTHFPSLLGTLLK